MPTLATEPAVLVPNRRARVTITLTETGTNWVSIWLTDAPEGSELKRRLDRQRQPRLHLHSGAGAADLWLFDEADKGGVYTLAAQEYTRGTTHGGGYDGDPDADISLTAVGSEASLSLSFAQRVVQPMGPNRRAELALHVVGTTIKETWVDVHGEDTPRIIANPETPETKAARLNSDVVTALSALVDVTASTAVGTLATVIDDFITEWNDHLNTGGGWHDANDGDNVIDVNFKGAASEQDVIDAVNQILKSIPRHYTNDSGTGPGSATHYHKTSGEVADRTNMPVFRSVGTLADAVGGLADAHRSYEAHRVDTGVHNSADSTNTLAALGTLLDLHSKYAAVLASLSPTAPATENSGVTVLVKNAGFEEKPL